MLSAQRQPPAMASGRQPEDDNFSFFGYSVQDEFPHPQNAPLPAGAPLLSDNERSALDDWLQIFMGNAGPVETSLSLDPVHSDNWNDMPPQFVGSTTSFGPSSSSRNMQSAFSPGFDLPLTSPLSGTQPLQNHQHQHMSNPISPLGPAGLSRSNSTPTIPLHHSPGLGHHYSAAAAAGNLQGAGAHNVLSEDVFSAANVLMQNSHGPVSRHASFGYQARPSNLAQYHSGSSNTGILMQNGSQQTLDPSHMSPAALLQAASHIAGPLAHPTGGGSNSRLGIRLATDGPPAPRAFSAAESAFHPSAGAADQASPANPRLELRWGTDQSFGQKQFMPRSEKETSEAILNQRLEVMECLEVNHSAVTTRQTTPTFDADPNAVPFNLKTRTQSFVSSDGRASLPLEAPDDSAPPRKKRKSKSATSSMSMLAISSADAADESVLGRGGTLANGNANGHRYDRYGDNDNDDDAAEASAAGMAKNDKPRRRKTKAVSAASAAALSINSSASPPNLEPIPERPGGSLDGNESSGAPASGTTPTTTSATATAFASKRRRSAQVKLPRENLSEEQKRENHIKSEQKRRTLIKTGFEDLGILVPGLDGGSHSKSTMLMLAANYLEELLEGNKQLRQEAGL